MSNVLQDRCSKCNLPLETLERKLIGLGDTCEKNAQLAYNEDVKHIKGLTGDTLFDFLAVFADARLHVNEALVPTLERLSLGLINHQEGQVLPFSLVLDAFSVARNSNEFLTERIHKALTELGFVRFINLASGETCPGVAILDFNNETQRIILSATVRRCASEVFNTLKHKRPDTNFWQFLNLRDAQLIYDTVQLRWPLPGAMNVTQSFLDALALSKTLPPEPPKPQLFSSEVVQQRLITIKTKINGAYVFDYKLNIQPLYPFITSKEIGGTYCKGLCNDDQIVYSVPEDKFEDVSQFLEETLNLTPKKKWKR